MHTKLKTALWKCVRKHHYYLLITMHIKCIQDLIKEYSFLGTQSPDVLICTSPQHFFTYTYYYPNTLIENLVVVCWNISSQVSPNYSLFIAIRFTRASLADGLPTSSLSPETANLPHRKRNVLY